jgi:glycosyltransferase involved in cell wall biosynthesis
MEQETIKKIEQSIKNLTEKNHKIYFLVQDTKGHAKGGVRYIYQMALTLKNLGYNPIMLYEKADHTKVSEWMGEEYDVLPTETVENQNLKISPEDLIVIPELYGHVMEQVSKLSCGKIVLCQSYDYMLETMAPGVSWAQLGFYKSITTSETQKEYIKDIMKHTSQDIIEPLIPNIFTPKTKPSKPIVSIHTRDQRDTMKIIKSFYLKYPQYRWITFRDMRGITQEEFATYLKDSFVSVWVDDISGFGTFPIESMACRTPVIGKVPNMKPSWIQDDNGVWTYELNNIPDIISEFIQNWLEDNIAEELYERGLSTAKEFSDPEKFKNSVSELFEDYRTTRLTSFEQQLERIKETETQQ